MRKKSGILFFLLLLTGAGLLAQNEKSFTARAPATIEAGQQFQYVIEGNAKGEVRLPDLEPFMLVAGPFSSFSSHSQWQNGKMTMHTVVSYTYVLTTNEEGSHVIPPATVKAGRKSLKTNEVRVVCTAATAPSSAGGSSSPQAQQGSSTQKAEPASASAGQEVFLRVEPARRELYVGEQFVSELRIYTRVNTRPASNSGEVPYEGFYKKALDPESSAQRRDINGQQYVTQAIQRHILIPQKTGELKIEPFESEWLIQKRVQRRGSQSLFDDFFSDPFFDGYQDVPVSLSTRPLQIKVKALPTGAPDGFTGGVGNFTMQASLSKQELDLNDALSLKIVIRGEGNLPLLGEPKVNMPLDHDIYDVARKINTSTSGNRISGSVTFEYPIVVRHAGNFRIPPISFSWFDPVSGKYKTTETDEFTFTVKKGKGEENGGGVYVPGLSQEAVDNIATDIRDISRKAPALRPISYTLMGQPWYAPAYLLVFVLALLSTVLLRKVARRNADLKLVRNRKASRIAGQRLKLAAQHMKANNPEGFFEEIGKAIWGYVSDKLALETSRLSRDLVLEEFRKHKLSDDLLRAFTDVLDESEFSRFAPASERSEMSELYKRAATLIDNLENQL
ncbi:MAG: hypothetical protein CSA96_07545 [Bacteroidetes bacterium]|nr:MAG: hypothetical protein CSA96_07545 [Bacteroidota bacterium]